MCKLKKIDSIIAKGLAKYKMNEYTTEYGTVIFDNSKDGKISNSFIYHIGFENYGHIDIYIDKKLKTINSIWFVGLNSQVLYQDEHLVFDIDSDFIVPFFDISIWNDMKSMWPKQNCQEPIEVCHNGRNIINITFGNGNQIAPFNENIQFQYDDKESLTGILIKDEFEIPKLIEKLTKEISR